MIYWQDYTGNEQPRPVRFFQPRAIAFGVVVAALVESVHQMFIRLS